MRVCPFVLLFYPVFFLCLLATWPVWAEWQGNPPLKNEYNEHEFLAACREGNVPAVEFYLADENFDPNRYFESCYNNEQTTGLYVAAQNGHDEVVQILANAKVVDLNQACDGATPVLIASQNGHHKVVQIFAQTRGVDLNKAWNGATPVFQASCFGHDKVVQILAQTRGVDLNKACDGATSVFIASQQGHDKVVKIFAHTGGVDLNKAWNGMTPLYQASKNGHEKVVRLLIGAGADPTIRCRWKFSGGIFTKTARIKAEQKRSFLKERNPEKYDAYSRIIQTLTEAEQQWTIKNAAPVTPIHDRSYSHREESENTHLLHHMRRLAVKGACQ